ncbi:MAG: hypothetical protein G01um10148_503 [Parcubacteria group bacterium Gr01-1014_8]|nr:MAG: hypothetical protein G01um10148_503 [Parcubacteria group bacterium Gr01-1014_8]
MLLTLSDIYMSLDASKGKEVRSVQDLLAGSVALLFGGSYFNVGDRSSAER